MRGGRRSSLEAVLIWASVLLLSLAGCGGSGRAPAPGAGSPGAATERDASGEGVLPAVPPVEDPGRYGSAAGSFLPRPPGLDLYMPVPEDNPLTAAKVSLGRRLFFDPVLSRDRSRACASCHLPDRAFGDTLPVARGIDGRRGIRNAPPLVNRAWERTFFWDGRVASLEEQALHPVRSPRELDLPLEALARRLRDDPSYVDAFGAAFPGEEDAVGPRGVARALASFVRTLQAGDAPFDRYRAGDPDALPLRARRGRRLFFGGAGCARCHSGPTFADGRFHNTGVSWGSPDLGRHRVTGREEDRGRFRTATLRELVRTAPYMHDGSLATLEDVVAFYDGGGTPNPFLSPRIRPLDLSARDRADLVAFLRALSGA